MTFEEFYWLLEKTPDDWELRLVFADWLEEEGKVLLACGQRFQVKVQAHPVLEKCPRCWRWWIGEQLGIDRQCPFDVPRVIFESGKRSMYANINFSWHLYVGERLLAECVLAALKLPMTDWLQGMEKNWPLQRLEAWRAAARDCFLTGNCPKDL